MQSFRFYNPTKVYFGRNAIDNLAFELQNYGKNILLAYGGGSIKKSGLYDIVTAICARCGKTVYEVSGIRPNPRTEKVYEGIDICKKKDIDLILAVGGGSVIDCVKGMAAGAKTDRDFWQAFYRNKEECLSATPIGVILTLPATGSEMNSGSVVTKWDENLKTDYTSDSLYPKFAILDPTYTYTLPKNQIIYGAVDTLAHVFEQYFSAPDDKNLSDDLAEAIIKNVVDNLETALANPENYEARSNLMWDSTMALNRVIGCGKKQDWNSHMIEHSLSGFYDIPHGAGLAIVFPNWMRYVRHTCIGKFVRFAKNVWHVDCTGKTDDEIALAGIQAVQDYFKKIGAPTTLTEVGIPAERIPEIAAKVELTPGGYAPLTHEDVVEILKMAI